MIDCAKTRIDHQGITESVISAFYEVYNRLGFGFFERIYRLALEYELKLRATRSGAKFR